MIVTEEMHDIDTPTGVMRTYFYRPANEGLFPSLIFYSEIFQQTAPIARLATILAGHGFVVLVPEIFHELNAIGTVLNYDDIGKDKGNLDKHTKALELHDSDTIALVEFARRQAFCSNKIGVIGVCIGGHLAFRAALNPDISGAFCLYPTDLHSDTLPCEVGNQSLMRCGEIQSELQMIWGRQDPHTNETARQLIYRELNAQNCDFTWIEVNGAHAFMRDEGERYDPELCLRMCQNAVSFFKRVLT